MPVTSALEKWEKGQQFKVILSCRLSLKPVSHGNPVFKELRTGTAPRTKAQKLLHVSLMM